MAITRNAFVELFWRIHPKLYRWTGGRIGGSIGSMPVLLLTTTGRKTGAPRTSALTYLPHGDDFVVIASVLGEPRHPAWWLNLEARPDATVEVGRERHAVLARQAQGGERDTLWKAVVAKMPDYEEYRRRTSRRIPVVVLERRKA
jgi:deazaflavin-dependent oxidoreductase (nitroreductase family)